MPRVLVVGAGPAGLVAGITLARQGVDVLVVEQRPSTSSLSRALVISTRSMEIMRSWRLEDEVRAGAADVESRAWVARTLAAEEGSEVPLGLPTAEQAAAVSPSRPAWTPQDHVEPILLAHLRSLPSAEVRFSRELVALEQGDAGVRAALRDIYSGATEYVEAAYVVGADGAHSAVRAHVGIAMEGPDDLGEYHRVEFRAELDEVLGGRRYGLYVITHPDVAGVMAPRGRKGRWGLTWEWRPGRRGLPDHDPDSLLALVATAVGVQGLPIDLERTSSFSFAAQLADRYREGRAFLVGDAAHRMTPRGGTGLNTAVQDAYDLGWKLGWVLRGWADPGLLDSYTADRRPVGLHNVQRSGDPDGARRDVTDALPWDLGGRIAHHWVRAGVSTLDLLAEGLTLLSGPAGGDWVEAVGRLPLRAPVTTRRLDEAAAAAVEIEAAGAVLVRPDGHAILRWPDPIAVDAGASALAPYV